MISADQKKPKKTHTDSNNLQSIFGPGKLPVHLLYFLITIQIFKLGCRKENPAIALTVISEKCIQ